MQNAGMILYILFWGTIAGGVWTAVSRGSVQDGIAGYGLKSVLFFFAGIYFTASAIKLWLGEAGSTLPESFWDGEGRTYLHYGIVFVVVAAAVIALMRRLPRSCAYHFVHIFDLCYGTVMAGALLLTGRIDNRMYCTLYVLALSAGFAITWLSGREICCRSLVDPKEAYTNWQDFRKSFRKLLPFVGAWVVMTGIYLPNELYLHNLEEFAGDHRTFFAIMLACSLTAAVLIILAILLFVPRKLVRGAYLLFAGIGCAGYLQGMFLNGELSALNGEEQVWQAQTVILNCVVWIAILAAAVIGGYRSRAVRNVLKALCIYITLVQIVTLGWLVVTTDLSCESQNAAITKEGALEVAAENNVLVFVLDNFDSEWFEAIYHEDGSILEPLADFTYYRNGTSQFAHTNPGIPYMLTGAAWDDGTEDYFQSAYQDGSYLETIAAQGTDVRVYTELNLIGETLWRQLGNYRDTLPVQYDCARTFWTMVRTSLYKTAPFLMKPLYEYYTSDIKAMTYNENGWSIDNDKLFYDDLVKNKLTVSDEQQSAFRFYHMRGPHAPFYLTEDLKYEPTGRASTMESQGKGSLKVVYAYMEQLRALGRYDEATIIITADHGQGNILGTERYSGQPDRTSRTLFLVKKPGEIHESMVISEAPVSQAELVPSILDAFGLEYAACGRTFEEIPVDEERVRKYVDIYDRHRIVYSIDGHAADLDSWTIESAEYE
ncbi:MAG: LTA synthase family protein [Lachnospiraceae bacterium]|nr:LTA synthase family protein [Lachnospiraceae bacterium]